MWNSLRVRLTIIFIGLAIGPLLIVGAILAQRAYTIERDQALTLQNQVAQNASSQVDGYFQGVVNNLNGIGDEIRALKQPDQSQLLSILLTALSSGPYQNVYDELSLLNPQGVEEARVSHKLIVPMAQLQSQAGADEFERPKATHATYFGPVSFDKTTGTPFITIAIPIYQPRSVQLSYVLVANIRFAAIADLIAQVAVGQGETVYITDPSGKVVAHQDRSFNLQNARIQLPAAASLQTGLNGTYDALGVNALHLGDQTLTIVAEKPASDALSLAYILINTLILATFAALLISSILGFLIVRQIVLPIESLAATSQRITAGDLSSTTTIKRSDEIGTLAVAFNSMTLQLRETLQGLEQRVADRTQELERQSLRLRTAAEVARDAASALNLDDLLSRSSRLISNRLNFYHTGIFLMDQNKEYAVLRASPTEAGRTMMANNHRLRTGEQGIVGRVAATGEPRIALDTGADSVFFNNPLLPATRSEMALPLNSKDGVIGVLDIQSEEPSAFVTEDIAIMQIVADQLTSAIERIRLFEQVQSNLSDLEQSYGDFTERTWRTLTEGGGHVPGYRFDGVKLEALRENPQPAGLGPGNTSGAGGKMDSVAAEGSRSIPIPIRLRGRNIGVVNVRFQGNQTPQNTIVMIEQIADRLATALEYAQLLEESRQRAGRDTLVGEISSRFRSTLNVELVLRTATQELQKAFKLKEAEVRLGGREATPNQPSDGTPERKNGRRK
jgi:GAF domain-containing protein